MKGAGKVRLIRLLTNALVCAGMALPIGVGAQLQDRDAIAREFAVTTGESTFDAVAREFTVTAGKGAPIDAVSRELQVLVRPQLITNAVSREFSVNASAYMNVDAVAREFAVSVSPPSPADAVSRELQVLVRPQLITDAVTREFTVNASAFMNVDAVTREFAVSVASPLVADAVSREFNVVVDGGAPADSIAREFAVFAGATPETTIVGGPSANGIACSLPVEISWSGSDPTAPADELVYSWRTDGGEWNAFSPALAKSIGYLTPGPHVFEVKARNASGIEDPSPASLAFTLSTASPSVFNVAAAPAPETVTITWVTDKPATSQVEYGLTLAYGSITLVEYEWKTSHSISLAGLTPGAVYHYRVKSRDVCNRETVSQDDTFTIPGFPDLQVVSVSAPEDTIVFDQPTVISWVERNDSAEAPASGLWIDRVYLSTDSALGAGDRLLGDLRVTDSLAPRAEVTRQITATVARGATPAGPYYLIVVADATDLLEEAGFETNNTRSAVVHLRNIADTTPPDTAITGGPAEGSCAGSQPVTFTWTGSDNVAKPAELVYSYQLDSQPWSAWSGAASASLSIAAEGAHTFRVKARDFNDNEDPTPATRTFTVDLTPPEITNPAAAPGSSQATITWNTSEPATSQVEYGLTAALGSTTPLDPNLVRAHSVDLTGLQDSVIYYYRVISKDACGQTTTSAIRTFPTGNDITPPETTITGAPAGCSSTVTIVWSAKDNVTQTADLVYSWRIDSQAFGPETNSTTAQIPSVADGQHTFQVKARDRAGNWDATPAFVQFTVDTVKPVNSALQTQVSQAKVIITWQTNESCTSSVKYGLTEAMEQTGNAISPTGSYHRVELTGLQPNTQYFFKPVSTDGCQTAEAETGSFTTAQGPNLQVESIAAPATAHNGESISVQWTVKNAGAGRAEGGWVDYVYLSADNACSADDVFLGFEVHNGGLDPNQPYTQTLQTVLPSRLNQQNYWVVVKANVEGSLDEFGAEADNCAADDVPIAIQLLPQANLVASALQAPSTAIAGSKQTVTFTVTNSGAPTIASNTWFDGVYISSSAEFDAGATRIGISSKSGVVAAGGAYPVSVECWLPELNAGTYTLFAVADCTDMLFESDENNAVSRPVTITLGTPDLSVDSFTAPASAAPKQEIPVSWTVSNQGTGRAQGSWVDTLYFGPTPEALPAYKLGDYPKDSQLLVVGNSYQQQARVKLTATISGDYYLLVVSNSSRSLGESGLANNTQIVKVQTTRTLSLISAPGTVNVDVNEGASVSAGLTITNLDAGTVTGIAAAVSGLPEGVTATAQAPATLPSEESGTVALSISAADGAVSGVFKVSITGAGGVEATSDVNIRVIPKLPKLAAEPASLSAGMVREQQRLVQFDVVNQGAAAAKNVRVELPAVDWMSLVTPEHMGEIAPGASAQVTVMLSPGEKTALGKHTGNLIVRADGTWVSVPFAFTATSNAKGNLKIIAKDEFSYYAEDKPNVAGATVKLVNANDGTVVLSSIGPDRKMKLAAPVNLSAETGADGTYQINDLNEADYNLEVSAPDHGTFKTVIHVEPGRTTEVIAFLPRELVKYTWKVEPTVIEDRYDVTLEATFETHVPAPVMTLEPLNLKLADLNYDSNGRAVVDYTVSNHGLIALFDCSFSIGSPDGYTCTPLITDLGVLPGNSSITVPVVVTRNEVSLAASGSGCASSAESVGGYICEEPRQTGASGSVVGNDCPGGPGSGGPGGGGGPSGSPGSPGAQSTSTYGIVMPVPCPCPEWCNHGYLSGQARFRYQSCELLRVGDSIYFEAEAEDSGGEKHLPDCTIQPIPPGYLSCQWRITRRDGTLLKAGSGFVADCVYLGGEDYSCTFTVASRRECEPAPIILKAEYYCCSAEPIVDYDASSVVSDVLGTLATFIPGFPFCTTGVGVTDADFELAYCCADNERHLEGSIHGAAEASETCGVFASSGVLALPLQVSPAAGVNLDVIYPRIDWDLVFGFWVRVNLRGTVDIVYPCVGPMTGMATYCVGAEVGGGLRNFEVGVGLKDASGVIHEGRLMIRGALAGGGEICVSEDLVSYAKTYTGGCLQVYVDAASKISYAWEGQPKTWDGACSRIYLLGPVGSSCVPPEDCDVTP